ncbi:M15 family metallopeptidase [Leucobacter tenebrionis]|uniref:M15 family metallopeptidase n=1 Tax=Leucobacter tenebrionis TaxID=2873270 RepID=UPI001CA6DD9D|nr:M15 family metallopeptidase [Leucobacter tenebrionis]QZY51795.1 M15 family metallopeptidase [Leucobacter tenebrionis]
MQRTDSAPRGHRAIQVAVLGLILATATTIGVIVSQVGAASAPADAASTQPQERIGVRDPDPSGGDSAPAATPEQAPGLAEAEGRTGGSDGRLPDGITVFDDGYDGITNLRPELLQALRAAAADARSQGIEFIVNSGWRSAELQEQMLRDAVSQYGSLEEASRWVASPQTSAHVSGDAVDIDGADAPAWLSAYGASYGLCQTYANEPWHYELVPDATSSGCPIMYADPTEDPRLQQ